MFFSTDYEPPITTYHYKSKKLVGNFCLACQNLKHTVSFNVIKTLQSNKTNKEKYLLAVNNTYDVKVLIIQINSILVVKNK